RDDAEQGGGPQRQGKEMATSHAHRSGTGNPRANGAGRAARGEPRELGMVVPAATRARVARSAIRSAAAQDLHTAMCKFTPPGFRDGIAPGKRCTIDPPCPPCPGRQEVEGGKDDIRSSTSRVDRWDG